MRRTPLHHTPILITKEILSGDLNEKLNDLTARFNEYSSQR
ncbi:hypothetical protein ASZ90_015541 [hydrocarbon metagenome]|uniref:Uncharacterized protein n=1 Tax=hydrocarbon metagenome TaxID=938273 RepID=A0A0W8F1Q8_9ZZZZ